MKKTKSVFEKTNSILEYGIEPYLQGKKNYKNPTKEIEELAKKRIKDCLSCEYLREEPIDMFKVKDKRINESSEKMCLDCGCSIAYKIRQNLIICKKWKQ